MIKEAGNKVKKRKIKLIANLAVISDVFPQLIKSRTKFLNHINSFYSHNCLSRELTSGSGFTSKTGYGEIVSDVSNKSDFYWRLDQHLLPSIRTFHRDALLIRLLGI